MIPSSAQKTVNGDVGGRHYRSRGKVTKDMATRVGDSHCVCCSRRAARLAIRHARPGVRTPEQNGPYSSMADSKGVSSICGVEMISSPDFAGGTAGS